MLRPGAEPAVVAYGRWCSAWRQHPAWSPGFLSTGSGSPPPKAAEPDRGIGIRTGQKVFHTKFGEGKVLALEGAGTDARAQVSFSRHGVKWLALSVAKLTPVDD